jgi:hypothetical protein
MSASVTGQDPADQMLAEHLRRRGIVDPGCTPERARASGRAGGTASLLGVPGIEVDPAGGVTAFGSPCRPQERTLADLLSAGTESGLYFADQPAVEAAHGTGYNPVLYHAFRDFLPPRELSGGQCLPAGSPGYDSARGSGYQFADLIVYQPGSLPGDEPFRSTGHWNLPWQLEIFQTITGRMLMLVAGHDGDGQPFMYELACGPGEVMAVPFGIWHVSYVLDGPAAVFNVTADLSALAGEPGTAAGRQDTAKYRRADAVAATIRRRGSGYGIVASQTPGRERTDPPCGDWIRPFLAAAGSLAGLHLSAPVSLLASLQQEALRALRADARVRPARPGAAEGRTRPLTAT